MTYADTGLLGVLAELHAADFPANVDIENAEKRPKYCAVYNGRLVHRIGCQGRALPLEMR
jgi:hypothetical protein